MLPANRLPMEHPEYKYPPSRNPYWKKLHEFRGRVFSDNETEENRGRWKEVLAAQMGKAPRELHVEIGCNAGHVIVEWADRERANGYIGVEWKFKPVFRGMEKADKRGLKNMFLFRAHAERLAYMFGPGEIDRLCLYFPDPWAKKAQLKNRFVTAKRLREIAQVVRPGGIFHIKTDHRGYFDWMEDAIRETADLWEVLERTNDLHAAHPDPTTLTIPDVTLFERLFIADGIRINSVTLRRKT